MDVNRLSKQLANAKLLHILALEKEFLETENATYGLILRRLETQNSFTIRYMKKKAKKCYSLFGD